MKNNIAKIRAALESIRSCDDMKGERDAALAALAELERAAAEPVATVCLISDRFAHNHCIEAQLQVDPGAQLPIGTKLYLHPPAPVAAAPQFVAGEVTRPMCHGAWARYWSEPNNGDSCGQAMRWLEAWRSELGPALGLVEIREPTLEECERICTEYERLLMREGTCGGRDAFDAVKDVMWPKEGL